MGDGKIVSLKGGLTYQPEVYEGAVSVLEESLDMARSGEVVGVVVVRLHCDGLSAFTMAGRVGGYSMLGAAVMAQQALIEVLRDE